MTDQASESAALLDEELALAVRGLSKTYGGALEALYEPAVSLFALLRERRGAAPAARGRVDNGEPEDDDEDEEDEGDESLGAPHDESSDLHDLSFELRRGEAIGVVGDQPTAIRTLARVLCGMTPPSSGRILVRGRIAPSFELAALLTRRETSAQSAARILAVLAGPGRRHRRAYIESTLALALGNDVSDANLARVPKELLRRIAVAAVLDPFADVLVLDERPALRDSEFRRRWFERLEVRLAEGAAAVVTSDDPELLRLCGQMIRLEDERMQHGTTPAGAEPDLERPEPVGQLPPIRGFNAQAAILAVAALDRRGSTIEVARPEDELTVSVLFETAVQAEVTVVVRFLGDSSYRFARPTTPLQAGSHVALLLLPPAALETGDYDISVGLVVSQDGEDTKLGRKSVTRIRVEADEAALALVTETGSGQPSAGRTVPGDAEWSLETVAE